MGIECTQCGTRPDMPYQCKYCGGRYCPDHRLPEGHNCDGVEFLSATGKRFETKTGSIVDAGENIRSPELVEIEETLGTTPDIEYERSPPVRVKSAQGEKRSEESGPQTLLLSIVSTVKRLLPF